MRVCVRLILGGLLAATVGCNSSTGPVTQTFLRTTNASPDGPPFDIYVAGSRVVTGLSFAASTSYISIGAGPATVGVVPSGDTGTLLSTPTKFSPHHWYSLFLLGRVDSLTSLILVDSTTAPADSVRLRFVNGSPSSPSVDVYVKPLGDSTPSTPTFAAVAFKTATAYVSQQPASLEVVVTTAGSRAIVLDDTLSNVSGASVKSVVALDHTGGGPPLTAVNLANPG